MDSGNKVICWKHIIVKNFIRDMNQVQITLDLFGHSSSSPVQTPNLKLPKLSRPNWNQKLTKGFPPQSVYGQYDYWTGKRSTETWSLGGISSSQVQTMNPQPHIGNFLKQTSLKNSIFKWIPAREVTWICDHKDGMI